MHGTTSGETIRLYGFYETTLPNYLMLNAIALFGWLAFLLGAACLRNPPTEFWEAWHNSLADADWLLSALGWLPLLLLVAVVYTACEMVVVLALFARKGPAAERQVSRGSD
jgi:hypothetical protein